MTDQENFILAYGCCPDCLGQGWLKGPSAGMCTNWKCANPACGSRFNIGMLNDDWPNRQPTAHQTFQMFSERNSVPKPGLLVNQNLQTRIADWYRTNGGNTGALTRVRRLRVELEELEKAVEFQSRSQAQEEAADVGICLMGVAETLGCDLLKVMEAKHAVNEKRRWEVREDGSLYHVPGSDPREKL